ncbi:MAG: lipoprotein, partial [Halothiobacillaceae bacterium]
MGNSRYSAAMFVVRMALLPFFLWGLVGCSKSEQSPDPVVADFVVAYVKRPLTLNDEGEVTQKDQRRLTTFNAGGDLYVKERASPSAAESNITIDQTGGLGDVKDIEVSYDGTKILFALRMPEIEGADAEEQPTWNIWEYSVTSKIARRIIESDIVAEEGQ